MIHTPRRCLGRLINHANYKEDGVANKVCNLKLADLHLNFLSVAQNPGSKRVVVLVANRDIKVGEQLFYDYGDKDARNELS